MASQVTLARGARWPGIAWLATPWLWLAALTTGIALVSIGIGRFYVPPDRVAAILLSHVLPLAPTWSGSEANVVELIRLPRIGVAATVGAGLAIAGAALQGAFRNPLIGPQIVGVSSGAAFGGALAIILGLTALGLLSLAFLTGLAAIAIVLLLARVDGRSPVLMLVLAGVVVSAFFSALVSLLTFFADPEDDLPAIVYWLMGSFASASYAKFAIMAAALAIGGGFLIAIRFRLNVLSLGDEEAEALGVKVEPTRWAVLCAVALLTAASVAVAGVVGWIGLVVPHLARMIVGPDHQRLLPAAALLGAGYAILIDDLARAATTAEIPLGILTAIVGAPVFAILLRRTRAGGWR
ncbi:MAG: iron ABC transporter permease [Pseudomonadota bacterium]